MPGQRPTPTHLKMIKGNPGNRPIRVEPQPAVPDELPEAPDFLNGYARGRRGALSAQTPDRRRYSGVAALVPAVLMRERGRGEFKLGSIMHHCSCGFPRNCNERIVGRVAAHEFLRAIHK